jgi:hypothetical protein
MRIDFVSVIPNDPDEFDEEENKVVTSSYFVKYLSDAFNKKAIQTIYYDE